MLNWYRRIPLIYLNLGAFVLGCTAGLLLYKLGVIRGEGFLSQAVSILTPFGVVLVNMLKMIVIPIIFFSLVYGAASLPLKTFGKMGVGVFSWYLFTSLFAAVFGSVIAMMFNPKLNSANELAGKLMGQVDAMKSSAGSTGSAFLNIIYSLFTNPFKALADGNFLPIIVFAILFGLAARTVLDSTEDERTKKIISSMLDLIEAMQKTIFKMIEWVMLYFPV